MTTKEKTFSQIVKQSYYPTNFATNPFLLLTIDHTELFSRIPKSLISNSSSKRCRFEVHFFQFWLKSFSTTCIRTQGKIEKLQTKKNNLLNNLIFLIRQNSYFFGRKLISLIFHDDELAFSLIPSIPIPQNFTIQQRDSEQTC